MPKFDLCIIPAAGKGTRMGDLCKDKAKCMLEVNNKPILDHILDYWRPMVTQTDIVIAPRWQEKMQKKFWCTVQSEPLGINDAILCSLRHVGTPEHFLVVLGDCLVAGEFDWSVWQPGQHGIGVMDGNPDFARSYAVGMNSWHEPPVVWSLIEKPKMGMGVYLLNWKCIPVLEKHKGITEAIEELAKTYTVVPIPFTGRYLNVTEPGDLTRW